MSDKVWREGAPGEPKFPDKFDVIRKAVLQVTDIETNRNKYYAVELHAAKNKYRVYTHYGRTDDLDTNPNAGARESRYFDAVEAAQSCYDQIYREKTSARKGYKELSLASSRIGSSTSRNSPPTGMTTFFRPNTSTAGSRKPTFRPNTCSSCSATGAIWWAMKAI